MQKALFILLWSLFMVFPLDAMEEPAAQAREVTHLYLLRNINDHVSIGLVPGEQEGTLELPSCPVPSHKFSTTAIVEWTNAKAGLSLSEQDLSLVSRIECLPKNANQYASLPVKILSFLGLLPSKETSKNQVHSEIEKITHYYYSIIMDGNEASKLNNHVRWYSLSEKDSDAIASPEFKDVLEIASQFFHHKKISDSESAAKFGGYFDQNIDHNFQMYIPLQFMEQHYQHRSDIQQFVAKRKKKQQGRLDAADAAISVLLLPAVIVYAATGGL